MRRPLPPELVRLGDELETAAARSLARRRTRRQLALNGAASLIVAVPVVAALGGGGLTTQQLPTTTPSPAPLLVAAGKEHGALRPGGGDVLPRDLRRSKPTPQSELLVLPSSLRPALR